MTEPRNNRRTMLLLRAVQRGRARYLEAKEMADEECCDVAYELSHLTAGCVESALSGDNPSVANAIEAAARIIAKRRAEIADESKAAGDSCPGEFGE